MTEYIPTDTDISEIGDYQDDYNSLLAKCNMLTTENEILKKQLKDEIFERDNRIQHLIFENERLKSSLESANNLLTFFQSQDNSKFRKINEQLSTKNFDLEQINHALKRENFSLKSELDEIKIEVEKYKTLKSKENLNDYSLYSTYQGSKGIVETDGNFDAIACTNTESNSNGVFPSESRGSLNRAYTVNLKKGQANFYHQQKSSEDNNAFIFDLNKASSADGVQNSTNRSVGYINSKNYENIEGEKFMIDEKLSENDLYASNDNEVFMKNKIENSSIINNDLENYNNNLNKENGENINLDDSCDSSSEDIRNMTTDELRVYIKKIKKESKDFYKKALDMLTENEFEVIKLKSENEQLREVSNINGNSYKERNSINSQNINNLRNLKRKSDTINESLDIKNLMEELDLLKKENIERQNEFENERNLLNQKISHLEVNNKITASEYENEIFRLKFEIENLEMEKNILEKDIYNKKNSERNNFAENLEQYNQIIRNLEEQKEKSDINYKTLVDNLMSEKKKMEKNNLENLETIQKLEKEIKMLKDNKAKSIKDLSDNFKSEKQMYEREAIELRGNNGVLTKEKELLRKEFDGAKASYKNAKIQINDLSKEIAKLKESKIEEIKKLNIKLEETLEELSSKHHNEKLNMQERINELMNKLEEKELNEKESENSVLYKLDTKYKRNSVMISEIIKGNVNNNTENIADSNCMNKENSSNIINNFNFEALNREIENLKSKNFKLQVEITNLNNKLKVKDNKIANTIRLKNEIDTLKKEKSKYKSDILELKKLYEEQINELMEKLNSANKNNNNENLNNNSENLEAADAQQKNKNDSHIINFKETIEDLNEQILKLNYEKKFLNDQVIILTKELENMEKLKNDYIKKLKEDLEHTEEIAATAKLSVAQILFEKETEIVKYKKFCKKMKMKMQAMKSGTPLIHNENNNNITYGIQTPDRRNLTVNLAEHYKTNSSQRLNPDLNVLSNTNNNGSISARVNTNEYGSNVNNNSSRKSFFDKLFSK